MTCQLFTWELHSNSDAKLTFAAVRSIVWPSAICGGTPPAPTLHHSPAPLCKSLYRTVSTACRVSRPAHRTTCSPQRPKQPLVSKPRPSTWRDRPAPPPRRPAAIYTPRTSAIPAENLSSSPNRQSVTLDIPRFLHPSLFGFSPSNFGSRLDPSKAAETRYFVERSVAGVAFVSGVRFFVVP